MFFNVLTLGAFRLEKKRGEIEYKPTKISMLLYFLPIYILGRFLETLIILNHHTIDIASVVMNEGSTLLLLRNENGYIYISKWNESGWICNALKRHVGRVNSVEMSHHSNCITPASHNGTIRVWSSPFGCQQPLIRENKSGVGVCVSFKKDKKCIVSCSADHSLTIWTFVDNEWKIVTLQGHEDAVSCVHVSKSVKVVNSGSVHSISRGWQFQRGVWKSKVVLHHSGCMSLWQSTRKNPRWVSLP